MTDTNQKSINKSRAFLKGAVSFSVIAALAACSDSTDYNFTKSIADAGALVAPAPAFDPANGVIPFPNNLLFAGSEDGTLNIPVEDAADLGDPQVALNALDGFSTTEPMSTGMSQPLSQASLVIGSSVRVFEVITDPATTAVGGVVRELAADEIVAVASGADGSTLAIVPTRPLKESTDYMIVLDNQIKDSSERAIGRSFAFGLVAGEESLANGAAAALEPVRQLTGAMLLAAGSQGINPDDVTMIWSYKTQSTTPTLQAVKNSSVASALAVGPSGLDTTAVGGMGNADIHVGTLDVPYYLTAPSVENPTAALDSYWQGQGGSNLSRFNPQPVATSTQSIPVLMTIPNSSAGVGDQPAAGWPIAIFQHGITRSRTDMLAIADSMARAGFAVIAIDIPVHGITDTESPLYMAANERTFNMDLQDADSSPGPDGTIDPSGTYFYNLRNLLNTRDNLRQAIADLWVLSASVGNLQNVDGERKAFVGLSLGAIVGSSMLAFDNTFDSATLASPGGGISRLFAASPAFGPQVVAGLAGVGITLESAEGQRFLNATQTMLDSADPVNHAAATAASTQVHLTQMLMDNVVLGSVPGAALSGTDPLAKLMGLPVTSASSSGDAWVRFAQGAHSALIDTVSEQANLAVTFELQTQMATYAVTQGTSLPITDTTLLEAAP